MKNDILVGDVFAVVENTEFVQNPLFRVLPKGQRLWVREVTSFWPVFVKDDDDYAFFGDICNWLIREGKIKKIDPLEYPYEYYRTLHSISVLKKKLQEEHDKLKKIISENDNRL